MPQVAYSSDLGRLLGVRGDRPPNRCSTNKRDELPPLHSTLPQLEDTGPRYQVSWLIACNSVGIAASQSAHVTEGGCGSRTGVVTTFAAHLFVPHKLTFEEQTLNCTSGIHSTFPVDLLPVHHR